MSNSIESGQLEYAQWVFERNLHWIAAAEIKTGVVVSIDTAMLGALAAAYSALDHATRTNWARVFTLTAVVCLLTAVLCAALSVLPRTSGPEISLVFFGKIVKRTAADFANSFRSATMTDYLTDCLAQIHRNAEIACEKYRWVRASMMWSFAALIPWVLAIASLVRA